MIGLIINVLYVFIGISNYEVFYFCLFGGCCFGKVRKWIGFYDVMVFFLVLKGVNFLLCVKVLGIVKNE